MLAAFPFHLLVDRCITTITTATHYSHLTLCLHLSVSQQSLCLSLFCPIMRSRLKQCSLVSDFRSEAARATSHTAAHPHKNTARCLLLLLLIVITFLFLFHDPPKQESTMSPTAYDGESHLRSMLLKNSVQKILERRLWLSNKNYEGIFFSKPKRNELWYMFLPTLPCFWTFEKDPSSADVHDGGMWLCGLTKSTKFDSFMTVGMVLGRVTMILLALCTPWVPPMSFHSNAEYEQLPRGANSYVRSNGQGIWRRKRCTRQLSWRLWIWREGCSRWTLPDKIHHHHNEGTESNSCGVS